VATLSHGSARRVRVKPWVGGKPARSRRSVRSGARPAPLHYARPRFFHDPLLGPRLAPLSVVRRDKASGDDWDPERSCGRVMETCVRIAISLARRAFSGGEAGLARSKAARPQIARPGPRTRRCAANAP
jgi:hypothetical protein